MRAVLRLSMVSNLPSSVVVISSGLVKIFRPASDVQASVTWTYIFDRQKDDFSPLILIDRKVGILRVHLLIEQLHLRKMSEVWRWLPFSTGFVLRVFLVAGYAELALAQLEYTFSLSCLSATHPDGMISIAVAESPSISPLWGTYWIHEIITGKVCPIHFRHLWVLL